MRDHACRVHRRIAGVLLALVASVAGAAASGQTPRPVAPTDAPFAAGPDKALELAILRASPNYTTSGAGATRARYVHGRVDLNGDGREEVLAYLMGPDFCGTGGCRLLLFTPDALEPQSDAEGAAHGPQAPAPSGAGFSTVCGVTVNGKEYWYRCTVEGAAPGTTGKTVLHFPDNAVALTWAGSGKVSATFEGMVPRDVTVTTEAGVTRFPFDDRTYFFVSDRVKAAEAVKHLR